MKLFLISQNQNNGFDTYDLAVVAAIDSDTARRIHPQLGQLDKWESYGTWCSGPEHVSVRYLGTAADWVRQGVVLASFNAGCGPCFRQWTSTKEIALDRLILKWGTLKGWDVRSDPARKLLRRYFALSQRVSGLLQHDTPKQKRVLCDLIDACECDTVRLDWDGREVSKAEAKKYVMEYGK